ncbi:hypothetical protein F9B16_20960 [Actinomadura montaniterrae]|uniref:Uncharacterized protein n=1 Tax=Actinomadura montaniterrae TaxID=1803903 RepID=A0A6L3VWD5_9ACTN|nr:hypothetical protein F9B16_20960 [Actinomadura montaniterrae]
MKIFPAGTVGSGYLAALRQPFPDIEFVPTGGVHLAAARAFLAGGGGAGRRRVAACRRRPARARPRLGGALILTYGATMAAFRSADAGAAADGRDHGGGRVDRRDRRVPAGRRGPLGRRRRRRRARPPHRDAAAR